MDEDLLAKTRHLINGLSNKQAEASGLNPATIEATLKEAAKQYTDESINNPRPEDYLLIHNAMMKGWEMGIRHAIARIVPAGV